MFCTSVELVSWRIKQQQTEKYIQKCSRRPFHEEKNDKKIISITVAESIENVYHVIRQNLHFAQIPYNKDKN